MAAITAALVKELREKTSAGMMDCKNALVACDGDITKAIDWLREKGIAKSVKKAGRIAAEGLSRVLVDGNRAILVEINSETDFVAKNESFLELLDTTAKVILASDAKTNEEALALTVDGATLNDLFINATATIGEKIVLRRFSVVTKNDDEFFGAYMHMGGSISALAVVKGGNEEVAKDIAMQVASMNPTYVSMEHMPADVVEHERDIQEEIVKADESLAGKPEKVLAGIIAGRVSKSLQEISLVDQIYFKDQSLKVGKFLDNAHAEVVYFERYMVGEGIEKRHEDFAEEVAKQMGN